MVSVRTSVKSTIFFYLARLLLLCTCSCTMYHKFRDFIFSSIFLMVSWKILTLLSQSEHNIDPIGAPLFLNLARKKPKEDVDSIKFVV